MPDESHPLIGATSMTTPSEDYREIPLTKGQVAKVSPHRFEELSQYRWWALKRTDGKGWYAIRSHGPLGTNAKTLMHRQILGLGRGDRQQGYHINGDGLDNRDSNLRVATAHQNHCNVRTPSNNTSGCKGVTRDYRDGFWEANILVKGVRRRKRFRLLEDAIACRQQWTKELQGEFAHLSHN